MNKALKLITILLFAWAMVSCTKENDSGNGSGNGGNGTEQINYTYGYYHPAKKIKKVKDFYYPENLEFVWNGDDLVSINYSCDWKSAIYHVEYNSDGRISCIWDSTDMDNHSKCTYQYYSDLIEVRGKKISDGQFWGSVNIDYKIVNNEVYYRDNNLSGEFHLIGYINDVPSNDYDRANNPFKDLMWYKFIDVPSGSGLTQFVSFNHRAWSFHNLIKDRNNNFRYDYDNDNYPTFCWWINPYGNSIDRKVYGITYYPMGGNSGYGSYNGHDYVDLGLPSGTLWATCDIGANTPEASGDNFAWGETSTKGSSYSNYSWNNYKYCNGSDRTLTKYCPFSSYGYNGYEDNLTTLQPSDDAATANWGNGWRTPTKEELDELYDWSINDFTTVDQNGVRGYIITGPNGNSIILSFDEYNGGHRYYGVFWSSELFRSTEPREAYQLVFGDGHSYGNERYLGYRIRPVCTARQY